MSQELSTSDLLQRLAALEGRVAVLEATTYKRAGVQTTVDRLVENWPGPFTSQQILDALKEVRPDLAEAGKHAAGQRLYKLEKMGRITRTHQGCGRVATIWERSPAAPNPKVGKKTDYESGFRSIVRTAMASSELPEEFTLADIQAWMARNLPNTKVPYGSWSSTLYKLQQRQELVVHKPAHTVPLKVYKRGPRVVTPTGDELRELEVSWAAFKEQLLREGKSLVAGDFQSPREVGAIA